jgi:Tfp pilus assembly protein PilV
MKKLFLHKKIQPRKAFTLIETLLATMVISMVILGPLTVSITSSAYAKDTKKVITANYLAHEGLEIVRFKRDSVFVECQSGQATCVPISFNASAMENTQQASWRIFKERMRTVVNASGVQPSCFVDDNPEGCSFDAYAATQTGSGAVNRYVGGDDRCSSLYNDDRLDQPAGYSSVGVGVTDRVYVCKENGVPYDYSDSGYARVIKMTSVTLPYGDDYQNMYEDDVRVESAVTYTRAHGILRTVRAVGYLHARP